MTKLSKSIFKDGTRLYYFKGTQQFLISEQKCEKLFLFLQIKWAEVEEHIKTLKKANEKLYPHTIVLNRDAYKILASPLTKTLTLPIGTDNKSIHLMIIEELAYNSLVAKHKNQKNEHKTI